jgi:hypothetical protein
VLRGLHVFLVPISAKLRPDDRASLETGGRSNFSLHCLLRIADGAVGRIDWAMFSALHPGLSRERRPISFPLFDSPLLEPRPDLLLGTQPIAHWISGAPDFSVTVVV